MVSISYCYPHDYRLQRSDHPLRALIRPPTLQYLMFRTCMSMGLRLYTGSRTNRLSIIGGNNVGASRSTNTFCLIALHCNIICLRLHCVHVETRRYTFGRKKDVLEPSFRCWEWIHKVYWKHIKQTKFWLYLNLFCAIENRIPEKVKQSRMCALIQSKSEPPQLYITRFMSAFWQWKTFSCIVRKTFSFSFAPGEACNVLSDRRINIILTIGNFFAGCRILIGTFVPLNDITNISSFAWHGSYAIQSSAIKAIWDYFRLSPSIGQLSIFVISI